MTDLLGPFGSGEYGSGPYGGAYPLYGLELVEALNHTLVRVRYTALVDETFTPLLAPSNYSISPPLTIHAVIPETAQSVLLVTDPQWAIVYTLTISKARGYFGQPLDPTLNSRTFDGISASPTFFAVATRKTRVRAVFSDIMLQNDALTDPTQYALADLSGNPIPILFVETEQSTDVRSTVLTLRTDLVDERHYCLTTLSGIVTATSEPLSPNTSVFQWVANALQVSIPLRLFSGEVEEGLYGIHRGLVFFSPALVTPAANSIIQVEEVSVCTKAYDEYHFPQPIDPPVLFTHGAGVTPTPVVTTLNSTAALWARFPRLTEATFAIGDHRTDTFPTPVDGPCTAILTETWDLDYVSLLNNPAWKLFDNAGTPPRYFITANNLAPIPHGSSTIIILQCNARGNSTWNAEVNAIFGAATNILGDSSLEVDADS